MQSKTKQPHHKVAHVMRLALSLFWAPGGLGLPTGLPPPSPPLAVMAEVCSWRTQKATLEALRRLLFRDGPYFEILGWIAGPRTGRTGLSRLQPQLPFGTFQIQVFVQTTLPLGLPTTPLGPCISCPSVRASIKFHVWTMIPLQPTAIYMTSLWTNFSGPGQRQTRFDSCFSL